MSYTYKTITNTPDDRSRITPPHCFWQGAFTEEELDHICDLMSNSSLEEATIASSDLDTNELEVAPLLNTGTRRSAVSFLQYNEESRWIFERINFVVESVNNRWYNFDLNGYDTFQYTEYRGEENGYSDWHVDSFFGAAPKEMHETRKLSLTCLLNDPKEFVGGELQFGHETNVHSTEMVRGTIILFPSFSLHRVTPITSGIRKSLVTWITGPKFK